MILIIFSNVAIITALIFYYIFHVSSKTIDENLRENSKLLTSLTVDKVEKILMSVQKVPDNFANIIEAGTFSDEEIIRIINTAVKGNEEIIGMAVAFEPNAIKPNTLLHSFYCYNNQGNIITKDLAKDSLNYHILDWYQIPRQLQKSVWSEPYYDEGISDLIMTTYSVPIYREVNGNQVFIGVVTADISLDWMHDIFAKIKVYETGYAFLVSRIGTVVTHPRKELIMNETVFTIAEESKTPILREVGRNMIRGKSSFAEVEYKNVSSGKLSWISYAPVPVNGWSIGIVYPVDEFRASLNRLLNISMILALVGGITLLITIILIANSVTLPIRQLAFATRKFGEGDFDVELPKIKSKDEIADLTGSFASMQTALQDTISQLKEANKSLEEYSQTLEEKVEIRTKALNEKNRELDKALENVKTLSKIGRDITSTLSLESIFSAVYGSVNTLLDAHSFSIMMFNEKTNSLDCKMAIEDGKRLDSFSFSLDDENRFAVQCFRHKQSVFINDVDNEYSKYIKTRNAPKAGQYVSSLIYLPLVAGDKEIGVISVQSLNKNAYNESHLDIFGNLANYTAIALDNAFAYEGIKTANKELKDAQAQLIQSEKMASLGELTAGIAHEIKNPLNFINNFSELSIELAEELIAEIDKNKDKMDEDSIEEIHAILGDIEHNVRKINEHGKRADSIVKGMLLHSRGKAGEKQPTAINDLVGEYLNLAYHGFRAQDSTFNMKMDTELDSSIGKINIVPQDISRVLLNIFSNACYSVHEKKKEKKDSFNPVLTTRTKSEGDKIIITIRDNGKGIPQEVLDKVFNPFFTTKPAGKGTGLGLSLSYEIVVKAHGGELKVNSEVGEYAEFIIILPKN